MRIFKVWKLLGTSGQPGRGVGGAGVVAGRPESLASLACSPAPLLRLPALPALPGWLVRCAALLSPQIITIEIDR